MKAKKPTAFDQQSRDLVTEVAEEVLRPHKPIRQGWTDDTDSMKEFMEAFSMPTDDASLYAFAQVYAYKREIVMRHSWDFRQEIRGYPKFGKVTLLIGENRKEIHGPRAFGSSPSETEKLKRYQEKSFYGLQSRCCLVSNPAYARAGRIRRNEDLPCGPHTQWLVWVCPVRLQSGHHVHVFVVGNDAVDATLRRTDGGIGYYSRSMGRLALIKPE
jgi:hypothetical protein